MHVDRIIAGLARQPGAPVTREDLLKAGIRRGAIAHRLEHPTSDPDLSVRLRGRLGRPGPDGSRVGRGAGVGPDALLADAHGAAHWRMLSQPPEPIDVLRSGSHRAGPAGIRLRTTRWLPAERRFLRLIDRAELPRPRLNVRVGGVEVDAYWPALRFGAEVDGYASHGARLAFERDRRRDQHLIAAGVRISRVTWLDLVERPEALSARLGAALLAGLPPPALDARIVP